MAGHSLAGLELFPAARHEGAPFGYSLVRMNEGPEGAWSGGGWGGDDIIDSDLVVSNDAVDVPQGVLVVAEVAIGVTPQVAAELGGASVGCDVLYPNEDGIVGQQSGKLEVHTFASGNPLRKLGELSLELEGFSAGALTCM